MRGALGRLLAAERRAAGLSQRRLAARAAVAVRTVERLEAGQRRPTPAMLSYLARAIDPDQADQIAARLLAAAGPDGVGEDTDGSWSRRARRYRRAIVAGDAPLPSRIAVPMRLQAEADALRRAGWDLLSAAAGRDEEDALARAGDLLNQAGCLAAEAGPRRVILRVGCRVLYSQPGRR